MACVWPALSHKSILNISLKKTALLGGHSPRLGISCLIYSRRSDFIERKSTLVFKCSSFSDIMAKWSIGFRVILSVLVGPPSVWSKITNKNKAVKPSLEAVWVCQEPFKAVQILENDIIGCIFSFFGKLFFWKSYRHFLVLIFVRLSTWPYCEVSWSVWSVGIKCLSSML